MEHVYLLWHVYETERGNEEIKFIGAYSSEETGRAAIERLRTKPGFRARPDAFSLEKHTLNRDNWVEGYISAQEALDSSEE